MNRNHFEDLEYNLQERKAQAASWMQPAKNVQRFAKKSFLSKLVTFILTFKWGN